MHSLAHNFVTAAGPLGTTNFLATFLTSNYHWSIRLVKDWSMVQDSTHKTTSCLLTLLAYMNIDWAGIFVEGSPVYP
jgi:hypothetical protein